MNKKIFLGLGMTIFGLASCGPKTPPLPTDKTIIKLYGYSGGYGQEWMEKLCTRFADKVKDVSFEEGKTGVYFVPTYNKEMPNMASDIKQTEYDIMMTENSKINDWYEAGCFEEITDVVTGDNPYEPGKTILSKMTDIQKDALKLGGDKYYVLPTYSGIYGIIYNKDLFDSKNLYFNASGNFISSPQEPKSVGPDGEANTFDDGLPVTPEDFIKLCNQIITANHVPLIFSGQYPQYANNWLYNVAANIDGETVTRARYEFSDINDVSVAKIENGKATGELEKVNVTAKTGYELFRSEGFYKAFKLLDDVITTGEGKFLDKENCFDKTVTQFDAQSYFLKAKPGAKQAAMLAEGTWWRNEVKERMKDLPGTEKINFAVMPLPRLANQTENVNIDANSTTAFIKKDTKNVRTAGQLEACKKFLSFMYTDESMVDFSVTTDTFFAFNYDMGDRINELSSYGKSLLEYKNSKHTHILPVLANNENFRKNEVKLQPNLENTRFTPASGIVTDPMSYFYNNKAYNQHADTALAAFANKYSSDWWVK